MGTLATIRDERVSGRCVVGLRVAAELTVKQVGWLHSG
jgi:hypothetical protein